MYFCPGMPLADPYRLGDDRSVSKLERTARALLCAAHEAERCFRWLAAAEFYEAAAAIYPSTPNDDLLHAAAHCRRKSSSGSLASNVEANSALA